MSLKCPLCGKNKTEESLFCPDCTVKLNSEYELSVPAPLTSAENVSEKTNDKLPQGVVDKQEDETSKQQFDKKAWKKQRPDDRTDANKSYYEITRDKKTNKVHFTIIAFLILAVAIVAFLYIYNKQVKSDNLERAKWEVAQRENTVDSYLAYMDEHPQGVYVSDAQVKMMSLKNNETEAWQNLKTSDNSIEFTDFLERYPQSPYERKVKRRLDSLVWESSLKENSSQAYSEYINLSGEDKISGDYIGLAEKRFQMLHQSTPVDEFNLDSIRGIVSGFFTALSNISPSELSLYLAPVIVRFNNSTNISSEKMIGQLLLLAAKADAKSLRYDPEISKLNYEKMENETYRVNIPVQKIVEGSDGGTDQIKGYIVHLKLDPNFRIYSFHETKPFSTAP